MNAGYWQPMFLLIYVNWLILRFVNYFHLSEQQLKNLGTLLAPQLLAGDTLFLQGDLGAGKTTLVRALLRGLSYSGKVKSPTYTLVETYQPDQTFKVFHFDLYRLASPEELWEMGFEDYFSEQAVLLVEWPEKANGVLVSPDLLCRIAVTGDTRDIELVVESARGQAIIAELPEVLPS